MATLQDVIGWDAFLEGRVSVEFYALQQSHMVGADSMLSARDWMVHLIHKLLHTAHLQWIWNTSVHDQQHGYHRIWERAAVLREVERLSTLDPHSVPETSRYLLEVDFAEIPGWKTE